ncbi:galactose oxidase [Mytilinidion resinicola]|uniref:Galactose oxidase n=1 Tax=Mytilinidion resinicola TaxID=574789 RepID=A0A6A6YVZ9_9PEZI|nr:galactose oxidase [Mytilinidion resinicola]KAF2813126.1 galactose oxidase [Mytilinidion resinicola]
MAHQVYQPSTLFADTTTSSTAPVSTPASSANNTTFLMSASPMRTRKAATDSYRPKIISTIGAKPACLVNASVTYVGNDQIYAFGGFDQYTDEVYNHVLRLNLASKQWNLVDNYGDIPGVRMGHTANLWQGDKLLVYGGENEHRAYLSDVIIFDLKTAHWTQPELNGPAPRGRARHSAVIHDEKLYICGGMTGHESYVLDDICYLDLKTWTWSRTWRFVPRYDHTSWIWNGRIWIFGGLGEDMERMSEIWWLDIRGSPAFEAPMTYGSGERHLTASRYQRGYPFTNSNPPQTGTTGYVANSSSVQSNPSQLSANRNPPVAPGSISSLKFHSSPNLPTQALGTHFHVYSSGCLLDFVTPASIISSFETSLSALDLDTLQWQKLADGKDLFNPGYRWHYCAMNEDGTQAWLLGCPNEPTNNAGDATGEYLSDVLPIDLRKLGLLGNSLTNESRSKTKIPSSDANISSYLSGIGADLAKTFDQRPEDGSGADFTITADRDDDYDGADDSSMTMTESGVSGTSANTSPPIHVHKLILQARWPHFARLLSAQMLEYHTKKMHIPEPYSAVRSFLYYLYTDSIANYPPHGPSLSDVAGMLVMANIYDMPRLRLLCVNRLWKELDVEHAAIIWERAGTANEEWLKRRAGAFCMLHWGRVVRTAGFKSLSRGSIIEICEEVDIEGRVVGGDELEIFGGLGGGRFGVGGSGRDGRKRSIGSAGVLGGGEDDGEGDGEEEDEGMELN